MRAARRLPGESNLGRRYDGLRFGRFGNPQSRFGLELEFIHLKMVADTSQDDDVSFEPGSVTPASASTTSAVAHHLMAGLTAKFGH